MTYNTQTRRQGPLLVINNRGRSAQGVHFPNLNTVAKLVGTTVTKMDDHKGSSSGAKMPSWKKNFPYQAWEYETRIYAEYRGLDHVLKKENKPSGAPEHKPLATTKETLMAKVKINDGWMAELGHDAVGARNASRDADFDEDVAGDGRKLSRRTATRKMNSP